MGSCLIRHCLHRAKRSAAVSLRAKCLFERRSGARTAPACSATATCSCAGRALPGSRSRANSRMPARSVLVVDRYEIGERQTSACGIPTSWLMALELDSSLRQSFDALVVHTPFRTSRWQLPWSFSTFDYRELCALMWDQARAADARVRDRDRHRAQRAHRPHRPRRASRPADRGRPRLAAGALQRRADPAPGARLSRGLEVHPPGRGRDMELWLDAGYVRAGYSWSFPAGDELRVGVGSFWPTHHVKEPTVRLADDLGLPAVRLPGQLDPPPAAPGGRGRHLLRRRLRRPLPAADRRGDPHGVLLRARLRARAAGGARRHPHPRAGAGPLRRLLRRPRAQIPLAAERPAG